MQFHRIDYFLNFLLEKLQSLTLSKRETEKKAPKLKICILTTGPGKTLGDAALCEKLARSLLEII